jgi:glycosyltransferase involved in cell wall biosynthesis
MSLPSLSMLIPCYNGLPYVVDAVQSILDQGDEGVECVVIDDGSRDGSADALEKRFGKRIRLFRQANAGLGAVRNRALAEARGDLVGWLDADDLLAPEAIVSRRQAFAEDPQLEMLVGQIEIFSMVTGERRLSPPSDPSDPLLRNCLLNRQSPHLNGIMLRRSVLSRIGGFDTRFILGEDYDFWVRACFRLRWRYTQTVFAYMRQGTHESATSRRGKVAMYRDMQDVIYHNRTLFRQHFGSDAFWRQTYARWATDFALVLLLHGQRREAAWWAGKAIAMRGPAVEVRAVKYFAEAVLPPALYRRLGAVSRFVPFRARAV